MTEIMTASDVEMMTDGQIENAANKLRDALRKHRSEIPSNVAQQVLGVDNLGMLMFAPFRERAEAVSNLIVRRVKVNRTRTPQEVLEAVRRTQYTDNGVVKTMPHGEGDEVEVVFFKVGRYIKDDDLEKEYELRGLKPADPYSVAAVNEADHAFADEKPNATHWKDPKGKWCYVAFYRWDDDGRSVDVDRYGRGWYGYWWFAGLRK